MRGRTLTTLNDPALVCPWRINNPSGLSEFALSAPVKPRVGGLDESRPPLPLRRPAVKVDISLRRLGCATKLGGARNRVADMEVRRICFRVLRL
jgi:hypothetical protein